MKTQDMKNINIQMKKKKIIVMDTQTKKNKQIQKKQNKLWTNA